MIGIQQPTLLRRVTASLGRMLGYPSFIGIADFWCDEDHAAGGLAEFIDRLGRENLPKRAIYTQICRREKQLKRSLKMGVGHGGRRLPSGIDRAELLQCVSVKLPAGAFLYELVRHLQPNVVAAVGTGFGISGMFLGYGLEGNGRGHLYTFDPDPVLQPMGAESLRLATQRATASRAPFEEAWEEIARRENVNVDLAFVDEVQVYGDVLAKYRMLLTRPGREPVFVFDRVTRSAEMRRAWDELKQRPEVVSRAEVGGRFGVMQLDPGRA